MRASEKWRRRLGRLALGLALLLVAGATLEQVGAWRDLRRFPPPGQLVDLGDGRRMYLDCRGSGSPTVLLVACGSSKRDGFAGNTDVNGTFDDGGNFEGGEGGPGKAVRDPSTCEEAFQARTYVGCDYWPTVTANMVQDVFDFAVAVANVGTVEASVTVTGPNGVQKQAKVAPGSLEKIYLPWVAELKGGAFIPLMTSVLAKGGAYHLVSDRPVVVYQFNPLEFRAKGGEPGKDWSKCQKLDLSAADCYSYSNDASLLLPSTAMTGSYRIMGSYGFSRHKNLDPSQPLEPGAAPYFVVTGTSDGTTVSVQLGPKGKVVAGGGISATPAGGTLTFSLNAGDVAEVLSGAGREFDFSGSLLSADKPVQVITGVPCIDFPLDVVACDHVEETVFPAQTLGRHYVVTTPTGPKRNQVGHVVRFYGNVDGTALSYKPSQPAGCPSTLAAGEVVDCGELTTSDFEVQGTHELGIGMFMIGASKADPDFNGSSLTLLQGDPSQSFAVAVEHVVMPPPPEAAEPEPPPPPLPPKERLQDGGVEISVGTLFLRVVIRSGFGPAKGGCEGSAGISDGERSPR